jgi:hypothetical protein
MLKRAWFVFVVIWAGLFLYNGLTHEFGPTGLDVALAVAPLVAARVLRFIVLGARPRTLPYRGR